MTVEQMRQWEQATWATGKKEWEVIQQVGRKLASHILQLTKASDRILIICGKGHNGDDARATVEYLTNRKVRLVQIHEPQRDFEALTVALEWNPDWIIDGLFGIGLNRPLDEQWQRLINTINNGRWKIIAIDVPSGLNAQTGQVMGAAIKATYTISLGAIKTGLLVYDNWIYTGRLILEPHIGLCPCPFQTQWLWITAEDFLDFPPPRPLPAHKGNFGHLVIIAGSLGYHGAAVLAARAAQKARPGLISLWTMEEVYIPVAAQLQAVMVHPLNKENSPKWPDKTTAFLFGPGLATVASTHPIRSIFQQIWYNFHGPVVVDASALEWLEPGPIQTQAIRVITPHPGEAARLLKSSVAEIQKNRTEALRTLSARFGNCIVVLKGYLTLIGSSEGPIYWNCSGNPYLAQGGSGDVLAGYLAGWLAQTTYGIDPNIAIRYAVWEHGAAADRLEYSVKAWTPEDLIVELGSRFSVKPSNQSI